MSIVNTVTSSFPLWVEDGPGSSINYTKSVYFSIFDFVYDVVWNGSTWTQGSTSIHAHGNILSSRWSVGVSDERIKKKIKSREKS